MYSLCPLLQQFWLMSLCTMPQHPYFTYKMEEMKKIRLEHPEISCSDLKSQVECRWQVVDIKLKEDMLEQYKRQMGKYISTRKSYGVSKRTALSESASSSESSQY